MSCVYGAVQLLVLLLVQLLVLLLFSKIYHRHLHLFNHLLVKAVIKRQEDKLLERKWRKCLKIAEIKKVKENSQRPKPVQIQRKNNFSKTYTSMQNLQENVHNLTQTMTQEFLGQMMNQGVPRNPPPSHYQPSNFGSPVTSSFSCEVIPRGILIWGNHRTSLRDTIKTIVAFAQMGEEKHTIHVNLKT